MHISLLHISTETVLTAPSSQTWIQLEAQW